MSVIRSPHRARFPRARQQGMVLLVALVVLVAIMVAATAMMRSVDTATLVSGNLAFQQSATSAADRGVEQAIAMLKDKRAGGSLDTNDTSNGYYAKLRSDEGDNPAAGQSWQSFWQETLKDNAYDAGEDAFGNQIWFVVHRICNQAAAPNLGGDCVASPTVMQEKPNPNIGSPPIQAATAIYYRITVRVVGPRRTESYVQTHISM
jgi:Tfp pilus assembly protein PilX